MTKISEIGNLKNGLNFNRGQFGKGIRVVNVKQLYSGRYVDLKNLETIKTDDISNLKSYLLEEGDILFSRSSIMRSGAGKSAVVPKLNEETSFSGFVIRLRIKDKNKFDPLFLIYILSTPKYRKLFQQFSTGTSISNVSQDLINSVEIEIPDIKIQKKLTHIINTFNNKIELNKKTNQTLDEITKKLFKSWFINFDPVKAKTELKSTGLSKKISDLFPDSFEDSESGKIPKGWKVAKLSDVTLEIESGRRPKGGIDISLKSGIPSVGAESIRSIGNFDYSKVKFISPEFASKMKKGKVQNFDVALYKDGGRPGEFIPRVAIYGEGFPFSEFFVNEHVFLLRSKILGQPYLYRLISSPSFLHQLIATGSSKAAQPGLNQEEVINSSFIFPNKSIIDCFNKLIEPILNRQFLLGRENLDLCELRDTLLPKVISGKLKISDLKKTVNEVSV